MYIDLTKMTREEEVDSSRPFNDRDESVFLLPVSIP